MKHISDYIKKNPLLILVIALGFLLHLLVVFPSGSHYCFEGNCGDYYWGVHEQDALWHISVAATSFKSVPPVSPVFSGVPLSGYNTLIDFVLYLFKFIGISPFTAYFKILPLVWFMSFTYTAIKLAGKISKDKLFRPLFLFMAYFGASLTFLIPLIRSGTVRGNVTLSVTQPILTLTNIQLAFSYVLLFWTVILLLEKKLSWKHMVLLGIAVAVQWGLKFYTGFIALNMVGITCLIRLIRSRQLKDVYPAATALAFSAFVIVLTYNPLGSASQGSVFVWNPLALVWPLVEERDMLYSSYLANAKYAFLAAGRISPRFLLLEGVLIVLYIVLNFGPRVLGLFYLAESAWKRKTKDIDIAIFVSAAVSFSVAMLFVQRGVWWNIVQFLFPVLMLLNIYTALFVSRFKNIYVKSLLFILIVAVSVPYCFEALADYGKFPGVVYVMDRELKALDFLKKAPDGVVYVPLARKSAELNSGHAVPIFYHVDSAYVSAYTGKQTLYSDQLMVEELVDKDLYQSRKKLITAGDCGLAGKISYIYYHNSQKDLFINKCVIGNKSFRTVYTADGFNILSRTGNL